MFSIFTNNCIVTDDVKIENTVLTKDNIVIIDPDLFLIAKNPIDYIICLNKKNLLRLFQIICKLSVAKELNYQNNANKIDFELVNFKIKENTNVTYELSKRLNKSKKLIDYFN